MTIHNTMKVAGWVGTMGAGLLAAKGLGEFLPASKTIVWSLGGALEVANIITLTWLSHGKGNVALRCFMGALCAIVMVLDVMGVSGQLSSSYQARVNANAANTEQTAATIDAKIEAAKATVADIDGQIKGADEQIKTAKLKATREHVEARRAALAAQREQAQSKVVALQIEKAQAKGHAVEASSEFAAAQFIGGLIGIGPDAVAQTMIALISSLATLFSFGLLLASGAHADPAEHVAPPARVIVAPPATIAPPARAKDPKRVAAGIKAAETRKRNAAARAAAQNGGQVVAFARP